MNNYSKGEILHRKLSKYGAQKRTLFTSRIQTTSVTLPCGTDTFTKSLGRSQDLTTKGNISLKKNNNNNNNGNNNNNNNNKQQKHQHHHHHHHLEVEYILQCLEVLYVGFFKFFYFFKLASISRRVKVRNI